MVTQQYVSLFSGHEVCISLQFLYWTDTGKNVSGDINIRTQVSKTCPPFTEPLIYVGIHRSRHSLKKYIYGTPQTFRHLHRMTIFYIKDIPLRFIVNVNKQMYAHTFKHTNCTFQIFHPPNKYHLIMESKRNTASLFINRAAIIQTCVNKSFDTTPTNCFVREKRHLFNSAKCALTIFQPLKSYYYFQQSLFMYRLLLLNAWQDSNKRQFRSNFLISTIAGIGSLKRAFETCDLL